MPAEVSVIIPCKNEGDTIRLLLTALRDQSYPQSNMETIIADGLSEDDTRKKIRDFQQENPDMCIQVVDNPKLTIPSALNAAIHESHGRVIIRMDAHAIPQQDYIERCVHALDANIGENIGGVWDIRPLNDSPMAKAIAAAASHPLAVGDASYRHASKAAYVDTVPFGAFKRELLDKVGLFDESLLTNEDYEFNTRIRQSGGCIWLDPEIRSVYYARKSLGELGRQYWRYGFWKAQMIKRYPKTLRLRQALPPLFVASLFVLSIASFISGLAVIILFSELALYLLALLAVGIQLAFKEKQASHLLYVPLAIATMHLNWGAGFIRGLFFRQPRQVE
jgi:glycosyltransferase involved in cell wall biosynthesis